MTEIPPLPQEKLRKMHIVVEAIICTVTVLSIPTVLLPFVLVPIAFAYPMLVGRPKLLFFPAGVAVAVLLFLLVTAAGGYSYY